MTAATAIPLRALLLLLGAVAIMAVVITLAPVLDWFMMLRAWLISFGPAAWLIYALVFVAATATVSPAAPFSIGAGLLFGAAGFPLALLSATAGAVVAFFLSRRFFRRRVMVLAERRPLWQALDRAIAEQGWRVVFLVRLSPLIPFNVQNYLFGITRVRTGPFVLATSAGIFANVALGVYVGTLGRASLSEAGPAALILPAIGIVGTLLVVFLISRAARRALLRIMAENAPPA